MNIGNQRTDDDQACSDLALVLLGLSAILLILAGCLDWLPLPWTMGGLH